MSKPIPGVYFVQCRASGRIKIGHSADVVRRLTTLHTMCSAGVVVLGIAPTLTIKHERAIHTLFAAQRRHGEWFEPTPELYERVGRLRAYESFIQPMLGGLRTALGTTEEDLAEVAHV